MYFFTFLANAEDKKKTYGKKLCKDQPVTHVRYLQIHNKKEKNIKKKKEFIETL